MAIRITTAEIVRYLQLYPTSILLRTKGKIEDFLENTLPGPAVWGGGYDVSSALKKW